MSEKKMREIRKYVVSQKHLNGEEKLNLYNDIKNARKIEHIKKQIPKITKPISNKAHKEETLFDFKQRRYESNKRRRARDKQRGWCGK